MQLRFHLTSDAAEYCTRASNTIQDAKKQNLNPFASSVGMVLADFKQLNTIEDVMAITLFLMIQHDLRPDCVAEILRSSISEDLQDTSSVSSIIRLYNQEQEFQTHPLEDFLHICLQSVSKLSSLETTPSPSFPHQLAHQLAFPYQPAHQLPHQLAFPHQLAHQLPHQLTGKVTHYTEGDIPVPQTHTCDDAKGYLARYQRFFGKNLDLVPHEYEEHPGLWFPIDHDSSLKSLSGLLAVIPPEVQTLINIQPLPGYLGKSITIDRCAFLTTCNLQLENDTHSPKKDLLTDIICRTTLSFLEDMMELDRGVTTTDMTLAYLQTFFNCDVSYTDYRTRDIVMYSGRLRGIWAGPNGTVFLDIKGRSFNGQWHQLYDFEIGWNLQDSADED
ncbi:hypothetical protein BELL_0572g00110 [Botrytis elliptica]|uniref:Uncharacterized protein n=1 Tax=Botrytis elliptica TaxID=278938 RepID=A0A4Z1JRE0_9HELO|nr:hypothetical protein BELL_0572g00110 [Botrytis elliptica]